MSIVRVSSHRTQYEPSVSTSRSWKRGCSPSAQGRIRDPAERIDLDRGPGSEGPIGGGRARNAPWAAPGSRDPDLGDSVVPDHPTGVVDHQPEGPAAKAMNPGQGFVPPATYSGRSSGSVRWRRRGRTSHVAAPMRLAGGLRRVGEQAENRDENRVVDRRDRRTDGVQTARGVPDGDAVLIQDTHRDMAAIMSSGLDATVSAWISCGNAIGVVVVAQTPATRRSRVERGARAGSWRSLQHDDLPRHPHLEVRGVEGAPRRRCPARRSCARPRASEGRAGSSGLS